MDTKALRQKILDLAIRGKLVPQDPNDEPASVLLERIHAEKERLIAEGKIKRPKKSKSSSSESHYQNFIPPFPIPDSWEWVRLEEIGEIITGNTPSKDIKSYYGGNIPFYKPTDLDQGINTSHASDTLSDEGYNISRKIPTDSVLVTCIGATIGKTGRILNEGSCNQQINAIIPDSHVHSKFLYFVCVSDYFQSEIKKNASATTLPILNKNNFSLLYMPLPPQKEQERIVEEIEHLRTIIDYVDLDCKLLGDTISSAKSKILELAMQGKLVPQDPNDEPAADMLRRVNPKARIITDNPHYPQLPDNWVYVSIDDINEYKSRSVNPADSPEQVFDLYSVPIYPTGEPEQLKGQEIGSTKQTVKCGDILLCKINPHLNRVWFIDSDSGHIQIASSEWIVVRSKELYTLFIREYFTSPAFRKMLCSQVSGVGGSLTRAQPSVVKQYLVPIPPYEEQIRIVEHMSKFIESLNDIEVNLTTL